MKHFLPAVWLLMVYTDLSAQVCPLNSNWSSGTLTHWWAYTGNNAAGNGPTAIQRVYDSTQAAPAGTLGNTSIYEYQLPGVPGIQILSAPGIDPYGGFATVPKINGFQYTNAILLGSTSVTRSAGSGGGGPGGGNPGGPNTGSGGGYVRGVSYRINVPAGPAAGPYTMTYAYAMVLENGMHGINDQPVFSATLTTNDSVITCASPKYFLPTLGDSNQQGTDAVLDSTLAGSEGFFLSPLSSPNSLTAPNSHARDVWAKGWTEVTFDLTPYRGQQVVLNFETDNCVPGGHFAYSYVAVRNVCGGLVISGVTATCANNIDSFSVPALTGAAYQWQVPPGWTLISGADRNVIQVRAGSGPGVITANELNSCANLTASIKVSSTLPTVAGAVSGGLEECAGTNTAVDLTESGNRGSILGWLASTDGVNWKELSDTTAQYTALGLAVTTIYKVLVENGAACAVDSSAVTTVVVDPKSIGGRLGPADMSFCLGQTQDVLLELAGETGSPVNWQSSPDGVSWASFNPADTAKVYSLLGLTASTFFRVIVVDGVCPADTSADASVTFVNVPFPQAVTDPTDTTICYGTPANLTATVSVGTDYTWTNTGSLTGGGDGEISGLPFVIMATAAPKSTLDYVLSVGNAGCPDRLSDTIRVRVLPPIVVDAGNDTSLATGEPLQLHASSVDPTAPTGDSFTWSPVSGLSDPNIFDPTVFFSPGVDSVRYFVSATSPDGCSGSASILIKVFRTGPDIFVPNAFTPGGASNGIFRPVAVGISSLAYFRVYNRVGQLVYSTSRLGDGWDGRISGRMAEAGTFVWVVQGTTYTGRTLYHKGTMMLIR